MSNKWYNQPMSHLTHDIVEVKPLAPRTEPVWVPGAAAPIQWSEQAVKAAVPIAERYATALAQADRLKEAARLAEQAYLEAKIALLKLHEEMFNHTQAGLKRHS